MSVDLDALPPIERDEKFDRTYIPLPGGYEVQTKGRGSSYRIYSGRDNHRWAVSDPFFHENITKMAMAIRAEHEKLIAELRDLRALKARVEGAPVEITKTSRGFHQYGEPVVCTYGTTIKVYESSSAYGPHVWLKLVCNPYILIKQPPGEGTSHLNPEQARAVVARLQTWLDEIPSRWNQECV